MIHNFLCYCTGVAVNAIFLASKLLEKPIFTKIVNGKR